MDRKTPVYLRGFSFGPCFDFLGRNRIMGSSFIGHHSLESVSVLVRDPFCGKDRRGKQLFPRHWDLNYIGLPAVEKCDQNTPTLEAVEIETILTATKERYRVLYALLAGTGIRISEALGLEIGKHLTTDCSIVSIRQQRSKKGHGIETYLKSDSALRDIDVAPALAALLKEYIGTRTSGFLFETSGGLPMSPRNIARDNLHPVLKEM